jgi:hypothetical protein
MGAPLPSPWSCGGVFLRNYTTDWTRCYDVKRWSEVIVESSFLNCNIASLTPKINMKKVIHTYSVALLLLLTSALGLTWLLSLRPIRIKIGDYYFNQGKFDQAASWYQTQQR